MAYYRGGAHSSRPHAEYARKEGNIDSKHLDDEHVLGRSHKHESNIIAHLPDHLTLHDAGVYTKGTLGEPKDHGKKGKGKGTVNFCSISAMLILYFQF